MAEPRVSVLPGAGLRFARYEPDAGLAHAVESYWTLDVEQPPATLTVLPDGLIDLVFVTGPQPAAYVTGAVLQPRRYVHEHPVSLLGVSLQPGAALPVLGADVASLPDGWTALREVVGAAGGELAQLVAAAAPVQPRLALLDAFLAGRLRGSTPDDRVRGALGTILARGGDVDIARLARESAASPRQLSRLFDAWVGFGPKRFARVVRVQTVLRRLVEEPGADLSSLAAELGFADHAHLTREVRELTGTPPTAFAKGVRAGDPAVSFKRGTGPGS